jgi:3-hydroxyacyl-[acyl-carrier-protein] dehydratase
MAQTGGILVGHAGGFKEKVVLAKVGKVELSREAIPGDTLRYTASMTLFDAAGASVAGIVELLDPAKPGISEQIGAIDLMFSHIDQNMSGIEFPSHNFVFSESFRTLLRSSGITADF